MKIVIYLAPDSGVHPKNFKASFVDHADWIYEWLDDEDEELIIEVVE